MILGNHLISDFELQISDFGFEKRKVSERADKSIHPRLARHPKIEDKFEIRNLEGGYLVGNAVIVGDAVT